MRERTYPYDPGGRPVIRGCRECGGDEAAHRAAAVPVTPWVRGRPPRFEWLCLRCVSSLGGVYGIQLYMANGNRPHTTRDSRCTAPGCGTRPTGHMFTNLRLLPDPDEHYCREHGEEKAEWVNAEHGWKAARAEFRHTAPCGPPEPVTGSSGRKR